MIIVTQNREELMNFDNVMNTEIANCDEDGYGIFAGFSVGRNDNYRALGYYKTKERAKEVLEEISFAYANMEMLKIPEIDIHQVITSTEMVRSICYKMPEK